MKKKNRFGELLEELMTKAELKNYVLAQELGYDVSYISKWLSGAMIPSEKNADTILRGISNCIVNSLNDESRKKFYADYYLSSDEELKEALYDNLQAEYVYVKGGQKKSLTDNEHNMEYVAQCSVKEYISMMKHPVLRKVNQLNVIAMMDILKIEKENRLKIAFLENSGESIRGYYPDVHFSLIIDLDSNIKDSVYNAIFLVNMFANFMHVDFKLYVSEKAVGKVAFAVKGSYSIAGMLMNSKTCMNVVASEDSKVANAWYNELAPLCNRETLAIRRSSLEAMVKKKEYMYSLIAKEAKWFIAHITESFLPHDLFEDVLADMMKQSDWDYNNEELRRVHKGVAKTLPEMNTSIIFTNSAFRNFLVNGEVDFYGHKAVLSVEQRVRCMRYIVSLIENSSLDVRMSVKRLVDDFYYEANPCMYTSEYLSYIRINRDVDNSILILNSAKIIELYKRFYHDVWNSGSEYLVSDKKQIVSKISRVIESAEMLAKIEGVDE